ncbi:1-acylglycerol-3-phosphate O-acyltransferase ABHD5 [Schistosoma japonicum]|nr:1-acylglycerol-3-phosphate O-acyltransferase ABHD5 [Schistosoma japonicum]
MAVPCNIVEIDVSAKESRLPFWLRWRRTSNELLKAAEKKLISRIKSNVEAFFVPIFNGSCYIRTFICRRQICDQVSPMGKPTDKDQAIPIVLIHGFGSGSALWCKNMDAFARYRPVYSLDVLGFGRSSRPSFPVDATATEEKWVESIEEWRSSLNLEKFILLGHSLDPWGFVEDPLKVKDQSNVGAAQAWVLLTIRNIFRPFNVLPYLRAAGPLGPSLIHYFRQDLRGFFDQRPIHIGEISEMPPAEQLGSSQDISFNNHAQPTDGEDDTFRSTSAMDKTAKVNGIVFDKSSSSILDSVDFEDLDGSVALDYVYHINCLHPSGETGFKSLCSSVGWPQRPMLDRIGQLDSNVPVTFIYGSLSWIDLSSGYRTRLLRPNSYVDVKVIEGAGHQVYAQMSEEFNAYVNMIGQRIDNGDSFNPEVYNSTSSSMNTMCVNGTNKANSNTESHGNNPLTKGHNGRLRHKRSSTSSPHVDISLPVQSGRYIQNSKHAFENEEASDEASD